MADGKPGFGAQFRADLDRYDGVTSEAERADYDAGWRKRWVPTLWVCWFIWMGVSAWFIEPLWLSLSVAVFAPFIAFYVVMFTCYGLIRLFNIRPPQ